MVILCNSLVYVKVQLRQKLIKIFLSLVNIRDPRQKNSIKVKTIKHLNQLLNYKTVPINIHVIL